MGDQTFGLAINTVKTLMSQNGCKNVAKIMFKGGKNEQRKQKQGNKVPKRWTGSG